MARAPHVKVCVICGKPFACPPSGKTVTCSPECRSIHSRQMHTGKHNYWSPEAKRAASERMRGQMTDQLRAAIAANFALPESQRGPRHRGAKVWDLIDPDGRHRTVVNLLDWARRHAEEFADEPIRTQEDRDRWARRIATGFREIDRSIRGFRKRRVVTYKGWGLGGSPRPKDDT